MSSEPPTLATFGETLVRLSPPRSERVATADEFAVHVGGAESNVAATAAGLGLEAVWLSKVSAGPPGDRVVAGVRAQGVEPAVVRDDARQGLYYFEDGPRPRGATVTYDRAEAAVTTATVDELPVERVRAADAVHVSGITPALSDTLAETTAGLLAIARDAGATVSFDPNYRSNLWSPATARETLAPLLSAADVLTVAERDAREVFGREGDAEALARALRETHDATVVVTRGEAGAVGVGPDGVVARPAVETETVDPVGSGDALVGALLARWLREGDLAAALEAGVAAAALARTVAGDAVSPSRADLRRVQERADGGADR